MQIQSGTFIKSGGSGHPNHTSFRRIWGSDTPEQLCQFGIKHAEYRKQAVTIFVEFEGPFTAQRSSETCLIQNRQYSVGCSERESMRMIQRQPILFPVQNSEILVLLSSLSRKVL